MTDYQELQMAAYAVRHDARATREKVSFPVVLSLLLNPLADQEITNILVNFFGSDIDLLDHNGSINEMYAVGIMAESVLRRAGRLECAAQVIEARKAVDNKVALLEGS